MKAIIKAFLLAILEIFRDWKYKRDHEEALQENARRDAEARDLAGRVATKQRIENVPEMASDDPGALREFLRTRDPKTK
jgi:hypothetical protein